MSHETYPYYGRLNEIDFLKRLYPLDAMKVWTLVIQMQSRTSINILSITTITSHVGCLQMSVSLLQMEQIKNI